jgi:hypothetical protein
MIIDTATSYDSIPGSPRDLKMLKARSKHAAVSSQAFSSDFRSRRLITSVYIVFRVHYT